MLKYVCPLLAVDDITRSRQFYETVLGRKVKFDFGENVTYEDGFAIHQKGHFLNLLDREGRYQAVSPSNNFELYFETDALNDLVDKLLGIGCTMVHVVREQPWGQRVFRCYDPDQHILEFGETMETVIQRFHKEGMLPEAISQRTSMPLAFVKNTLGEKNG